MVLEALPGHKIPHIVYLSYQLFMLHFPFTSTSLIWLIPKIKYLLRSTNCKVGCVWTLLCFICLRSEHHFRNFAFKHCTTLIFMKARHQVSHSYTTEGKITGLCVLKFNLFDCERWDKYSGLTGQDLPKLIPV
jgi:hypothetical protein